MHNGSDSRRRRRRRHCGDGGDGGDGGGGCAVLVLGRMMIIVGESGWLCIAQAQW